MSESGLDPPKAVFFFEIEANSNLKDSHIPRDPHVGLLKTLVRRSRSPHQSLALRLRIDHRLARFARKAKGPQPRTKVTSGINDGVSVLPDL